MGLTEQFDDELATIKKAPLTFAVGFIVLAGLIGGAEYLFFKEYIGQRDSAISTLEKQLNATRTQPQPPRPQPSPTTGAATANGIGGTANTGAGNTFNSGQAPTPGKAPKK